MLKRKMIILKPVPVWSAILAKTIARLWIALISLQLPNRVKHSVLDHHVYLCCGKHCRFWGVCLG